MNKSPSYSVDSFDPFQTSQSKPTFLGRVLGKVVVFARHKISGVSQGIHQSIENDVEKRLLEQGEHFDEIYRSREIEHENECAKLKRSKIKTSIMMLLVGIATGASIMGYWFLTH
ncbi:hypothetical protein [Rodentibacter haemolyticus]|uniref:Uncharacterized protein n=1 Tax=Rodentibacter haemolyticus TaxID=2778911 RepID=A0ABX6UXR0_9PAST|nr:hypothetical protein [Rodentibacter haemolyticus]QPB42834.1 hypothetical protein IHV77_01530 [Rodentibacter haemolyticus]